jgi:hypothetical protein
MGGRENILGWDGEVNTPIYYISSDDLWPHRLTATKVMTHDDEASEGSLRKCFDTCIRGLLALPTAFPAPMHAGHKTNHHLI